jgi:hypothetical protein
MLVVTSVIALVVYDEADLALLRRAWVRPGLVVGARWSHRASPRSSRERLEFAGGC